MWCPKGGSRPRTRPSRWLRGEEGTSGVRKAESKAAPGEGVLRAPFAKAEVPSSRTTLTGSWTSG